MSTGKETLPKVAAMMQTRVFGRTGMRLSVGFGCGTVGGLMVRGDPRDQERTIARAIDVGVNYIDTAVQYGNGESEKNLGRILQDLKPFNARGLHQGSTAECQVQQHCRYRGDVARRQLGATTTSFANAGWRLENAISWARHRHEGLATDAVE